jgi:hypothetical protein
MQQTMTHVRLDQMRGASVYDNDGRALIVEQMEVETLATEIQTGVQHCNASLRLPRTRGASLRGRPFFMAFVTIQARSQPVATHGNGFRLFWPFSAFSDLRLVANVCDHGAP